MSEIYCPYCGAEQLDMHNGGDPGEWWNNEYMPGGELEHKCDECNKTFIVKVNWSPEFEGIKPEDSF